MIRIRIILIDDHLVVRQKLKHLLAREPEWKVCAEAGEGCEGVRLARELKPDVLVTDLALPGLHGLEVTRRVHMLCPRTRIVIVSIHADEPYVTQALRNGAWGYVRKDEIGGHLLSAIRSVLTGFRYLSPSLREGINLSIANEAPRSKARTYASLNERERRTLQLIAQGCTNLELAMHLRLTAEQAGRLRSRLIRQLQLYSHAELVTLAHKEGLFGNES